VVRGKYFDIDSFMAPRLVFETETLLAKKMSELLELQGLDFDKLVVKIVEHLGSRGDLSPENRVKVAEQFAGELYAFGVTGISLKLFAFGLQVLGFDGLKLDITARQAGVIPFALSSPDIKLK
jgi:hypothetical protein